MKFFLDNSLRSKFKFLSIRLFKNNKNQGFSSYINLLNTKRFISTIKKINNFLKGKFNLLIKNFKFF